MFGGLWQKYQHSTAPVSEFIWELGDVGDSGKLRCLHGKVDTTISYLYTCTVGSAQRSGCMVYGPSAMSAI